MWPNQQWALNQAAYQNVSHEDVDWAALAQQWIKMKETNPSILQPHIPIPSPKAEKDQGEAPMDVDDGKDALDSDSLVDSNSNEEAWNKAQPPEWNNSWQQYTSWNWSNNRQPPTNQEPYGYTSTTMPPEALDYQHSSSNQSQPTFWTGQASGMAEPTSTMKDEHNFLVNRSRFIWRRSDKEKDRDTEKGKGKGVSSASLEDAAETLDAAKRKQLPAWIREGLEKMEREKQRKIDKERADREREEYLARKRRDEEEVLAKMDAEAAAKLLSRSKFDSDSDRDVDSDKEPTFQRSPKKHRESAEMDAAKGPMLQVKQRKSRFHDGASLRNSQSSPGQSSGDRQNDDAPVRKQLPIAETPPKSRQERMEEVMLNVRKTLTEILLDVTTEEMRAISENVYRKAREKAPAKRLQKSQAFASIATKSGLGLGIYGSDNEDDSGSEKSSDDNRGNASSTDSDEELEARIARKRSEFEKTAQEIEENLQAELEEERRFNEEASTSESDEEEVKKDEPTRRESKEDRKADGSSKAHHDDRQQKAAINKTREDSSSSNSEDTKYKKRTSKRDASDSPPEKVKGKKSKRKHRERRSSHESSSSRSSNSVIKKKKSKKSRRRASDSDSSVSLPKSKSKDKDKESAKRENRSRRERSNERARHREVSEERRGRERNSRTERERRKKRRRSRSSSKSRSPSSSRSRDRERHRDYRRRSRSRTRSRSRSESRRSRRRRSSSSSSRDTRRSRRR